MYAYADTLIHACNWMINLFTSALNVGQKMCVECGNWWRGWYLLTVDNRSYDHCIILTFIFHPRTEMQTNELYFTIAIEWWLYGISWFQCWWMCDVTRRKLLVTLFTPYHWFYVFCVGGAVYDGSTSPSSLYFGTFSVIYLEVMNSKQIFVFHFPLSVCH